MKKTKKKKRYYYKIKNQAKKQIYRKHVKKFTIN